MHRIESETGYVPAADLRPAAAPFDPERRTCFYGQMQEIVTFLTAFILMWNVLPIPGLFQFTGFFIGVGLSAWIVDEFLSD